MKKIRFYSLVMCLLLSGVMTLRAQDYIPVIQEGNEWNTLYVMTDGWPYLYYTNYVNWLSGDTIIDNVHYAKLVGTTDGNNPHLFSLLREEDGKVWKRRLNDSSEILLYDFTAGVGDTLYCGDFADDYNYIVVDSVSIENIGGADRKKFWFGLEYDLVGGAYAIETWIEGIGSDLGLLYCGTSGISGGYYNALCFHQNGEMVWQNHEYDECTVDVVEEAIDTDLSVYPNPTNGVIVVEGVEIECVEVCNAMGQLVKETKDKVIDLSKNEAGIYIIKIVSSSGILTKQVVKV